MPANHEPSRRWRARAGALVCGLVLAACGGSDEAPRPDCQEGELLVHRGGALVCEDPSQDTPADCEQGEALTASSDGELACARLTPSAPDCEEGSIVVQAANGLACEDPLELPGCGDGEVLFVSGDALECAPPVPSCQDGEALIASGDGGLTCGGGEGALRCADGQVVFESPGGLRCAQIMVPGGFVDVERRTLIELAASRDFHHRRGVSFNPSAPPAALRLAYEAPSGDGFASTLVDRPDLSEDLLWEMSSRGDISELELFESPSLRASHLISHIDTSEDVNWSAVLASDAVDAGVLERVLTEAGTSDRGKALRHPDLSPQTILTLANDPDADNSDLSQLARNPSLTVEVQRTLLMRDIGGVTSGLARNHSTEPALLEEIWTGDERGSLNDSLALNPNTPPVVLTQLLEVPFGFTAESAAMNPSLSELDRRTLSGHPQGKLRRALCRNPSLTQAEAEPMATHPETINDYARHAPVSVSGGLDIVAMGLSQLDTTLLFNPRTPPEVLDAIARGPHGDRLSSELIEHPNAGPAIYAFFATSPSRNARLDLATQERLDQATILTLSQDPDPSVRERLLRNPAVPAQVIAAMDSPTFDTGVTLASRPDATPEMLRPLYDRGMRHREALAANPSTPVDLLELLASDPRGIYSEAVAANPSVPRETLQVLLYDADPRVRLSAAASPTLE